MADNMSEQAEAIRKKREDARRRKQKQRERQRVERERQKQIQVERDNPINIWERHKKERPEEYAKILQRQEENQDDLTCLRTYVEALKAGKEIDVEAMLNAAASALLNIEEYGYDDHLCCPVEWVEEFGFARAASLRSGKNVEYYEFGIAGLRVPRDLWTQFVELAGAYIKRVMPDYNDETARRVVAAMRPPAPMYDRGGMRECPSCRVFANQTWIAGIRPVDVPWFVIAQFVGGFAATIMFRWLVPELPVRAKEILLPHGLEQNR